MKLGKKKEKDNKPKNDDFLAQEAKEKIRNPASPIRLTSLRTKFGPIKSKVCKSPISVSRTRIRELRRLSLLSFSLSQFHFQFSSRFRLFKTIRINITSLRTEPMSLLNSPTQAMRKPELRMLLSTMLSPILKQVKRTHQRRLQRFTNTLSTVMRLSIP